MSDPSDPSDIGSTQRPTEHHDPLDTIDLDVDHDARVQRHTAGAFDIRNFIGALIGIYGVILLFVGLFGDTGGDRTGGVNANLWAGIIMLVAGAGFMLWARLRPIVVPEHVEPVGDDPTRPAPRRRPGGH